MQTKSDRGDFSHGSIPGNILRLAVPITIAELIHVLYNVVDRMYIGHIPGTGTAALTGIGISLPLITLITAFAGLCGTGGAPLCSIARGKGRDSEAQAITETAFTLLLVFAAVLTGVLFFARKPLLCLMGADAETLPYAMEYFTIYLFGTVFVLINLGMNPFINAQGFSKVGMCTVLIGAVLNILLDPLFIFTFNLGVRGAAYATVISQFFGSVWVVLFLTGRRVTLPLRRLRLNWTYSLQILQLGATGFAFKITNSITQALVNATLRQWGGADSTLYIGAMSIINSLREVITQPVTGLTGGTQPVMGYTTTAPNCTAVCGRASDSCCCPRWAIPWQPGCC